MIKLAIVGYGKMGKEIESILDTGEFKIVGKYDVDNPVQENLKEVPDVAIEFSTPSSVISNIEFLSSKGINIVCGTTGWYDKLLEVRKIIEKNNVGFIYAYNFSVGVNLFFEIIRQASSIINKFPEYDIAVEEIHHTQKLDRPSGTAIKIAELILSGNKHKTAINKNSEIESASSEYLDVSSLRAGKIVGNHKVLIDSEADTITLEHNAKSRRGFAEGALLSTRFIYNKKGFYKFEDTFKNLI
jgi:4-hydroxy-tetrahydrodipicolinate reductase